MAAVAALSAGPAARAGDAPRLSMMAVVEAAMRRSSSSGAAGGGGVPTVNTGGNVVPFKTVSPPRHVMKRRESFADTKTAGKSRVLASSVATSSTTTAQSASAMR